ncbi:ELMO/CED-12 family-domain-containing protein [Choanephora cucurbitarum]|nr:ELMO/CED-12 family-domain-containing protein [Choanephora cucurbitarum]
MNWILWILFNRIYHSPILLAIYKGLKYITYLTTGTTEIYRLCQLSDRPNPTIIYRIDQSILYSSQLREERMQLTSDQPLTTVFETLCHKKLFSSTQSSAAQALEYSLQRIYQSNQLLNTVEERTRTKYDSTNPEHETLLLSLWSAMKPNEPLEHRLTKQWVDLGFQGNDPATDFRGMGLQGLDDLVYFSVHYPAYAHSILQHSAHPVYWYPYAIVGINLTQFAYQLLESKQLQLYLFQYGPVLTTFQDAYCYLFYQFNQFWITHEPKLSVMDFEVKFIEFKAKMKYALIHNQIIPLSLLENK